MPIEKRGDFELDRSLQLFKRTKKTLPKIIGNDAKNFFLLNFRQGGFTDRSFKRWPQRFRRISRTRSSRTAKEPANLIKSGALRRGVRVIDARFDKISVGVKGIVYARRHNEGITDKNGNEMPQRQYIGDSKKLTAKIEKRIFKEIDKVFK